MICDRCDKPMTRSEAKAYDVPGATGPGITIWVHRELCMPRSRRQTSPAR